MDELAHTVPLLREARLGDVMSKRNRDPGVTKRKYEHVECLKSGPEGKQWPLSKYKGPHLSTLA